MADLIDRRDHWKTVFGCGAAAKDCAKPTHSGESCKPFSSERGMNRLCATALIAGRVSGAGELPGSRDIWTPAGRIPQTTLIRPPPLSMSVLRRPRSADVASAMPSGRTGPGAAWCSMSRGVLGRKSSGNPDDHLANVKNREPPPMMLNDCAGKSNIAKRSQYIKEMAENRARRGVRLRGGWRGRLVQIYVTWVMFFSIC